MELRAANIYYDIKETFVSIDGLIGTFFLETAYGSMSLGLPNDAVDSDFPSEFLAFAKSQGDKNRRMMLALWMTAKAWNIDTADELFPKLSSPGNILDLHKYIFWITLKQEFSRYWKTIELYMKNNMP